MLFQVSSVLDGAKVPFFFSPYSLCLADFPGSKPLSSLQKNEVRQRPGPHIKHPHYATVTVRWLKFGLASGSTRERVLKSPFEDRKIL